MGILRGIWRSRIMRKGNWNKIWKYNNFENVDNDSFLVCKYSIIISICFWITLLFLISKLSLVTEQQNTNQKLIPTRIGRHLLETSSQNSTFVYVFSGGNNCSTKHKEEVGFSLEGCDFEKVRYPGLWIAFYVFLTVVSFIAIAIICDDFFVPSLEVISERMHLSEDVAGATFMAAGSSAPELFSSIAAVTFDSDVGIGTIVGSALFNLLVIIAMTAALTKNILHIDWRPLTRDSVFYLISIGWYLFSIWDTLIHVYDAVIMLVIYAVYIVYMVFNSKIMDKCENSCQKCNCTVFSRVEPADDLMADKDEEMASNYINKNKSSNNGDVMSSKEGQTFRHDKRNSVINAIALTSEKRMSIKPKLSVTMKEVKETEEEDEDEDYPIPTIPCSKCCCRACPPIRGAPPSVDDYHTEKEKAQGPCGRSNVTCLYGFKWIIFILAFPFLILFSYTIPDCTKSKNKKYFMGSFLMSVFWIMALSFGMVTVVARTGCLIGINTFVMSLVVLAAGTSIPDLLSSIIVARDGFGDMAVSNAIGSNVFDINLGLGLPFLIRVLINKGAPIDLMSSDERKAWCLKTMVLIPHIKFGFILIGILVICYLIFIIARFKLNRIIGISFFILYLLFLLYAFLQHFLCSLTGKFNC